MSTLARTRRGEVKRQYRMGWRPATPGQPVDERPESV